MGEVIDLEEYRAERERRTKQLAARRKRRAKGRDEAGRKPTLPSKVEEVEEDPA